MPGITDYPNSSFKHAITVRPLDKIIFSIPIQRFLNTHLQRDRTYKVFLSKQSNQYHILVEKDLLQTIRQIIHSIFRDITITNNITEDIILPAEIGYQLNVLALNLAYRSQEIDIVFRNNKWELVTLKSLCVPMKNYFKKFFN